MRFFTLLFFFLSITGINTYAQVANAGAEQLDSQGLPVNWHLSKTEGFTTGTDSAIKHSGRYAVKLEGQEHKEGIISVCILSLPAIYIGKNVTVKGFLRTENITEGYGGLWLRIDGQDSMLALDNMHGRGLTGTQDWQEVQATLPYLEKAETIVFGGLLTGKGSLWIDDLSLEIDGKDLAQAPRQQIVLPEAKHDTIFNKASGISIQLNKTRTEALTALGQLWGFLKYHHPYIAAGNVNWDAALMRVLPKVLAARTTSEWQAAMEKWVDALPVPDSCKGCLPYTVKEEVKLEPDYGNLFTAGYLPQTLTAKLHYLLKNARIKSNYYIGMAAGVSYPVIKNELPYNHTRYPDDGIRLLALYRYWNIIQYFYPNRHLADRWNEALQESIPSFVNARDSTEYMLACLALVGRIKDSHANIWNSVRMNWSGMYTVPFYASFIEKQLVITHLQNDTTILQKLSIGAVITHINGIPVAERIKALAPYTPASNTAAQLRDIPALLLRGNTSAVQITVQQNGQQQTITIPRYEYAQLKNMIRRKAGIPDSSYKILEGNIAYVYPGLYKNQQLPAIIKAFEHTSGMVIDMRCYPSDFMPFTFGSYIKDDQSPFVRFSRGAVEKPGSFVFSLPISNGDKNKKSYKGKIVVIVNELSQSQAEYTTMAFQSSPNVTVIGSTTAGADGNVSEIILPGDIHTLISGIGVYYPDKRETQQAGVKIDRVVHPTLKGVTAGKDELLEKAIELIRQPAAVRQ